MADGSLGACGGGLGEGSTLSGSEGVGTQAVPLRYSLSSSGWFRKVTDARSGSSDRRGWAAAINGSIVGQSRNTVTVCVMSKRRSSVGESRSCSLAPIRTMSGSLLAQPSPVYS